MEEHVSFTSLIVVILTAFLTPILLKKLRLSIIPVVVAEIIAGLIIGRTGFNLVQPDEWITILASLGFIFLMFLSGLEIDFSVFSNNKNRVTLPSGKLEPNRFLVSIIVFVFILILSFVLSWLLVLFGFTNNAYFMCLVISTISLGVVVPTLKETGIMKSGIGQIILIVTVIADLVTMVLLAVFVSLYEGGGNMWLLLLLFCAGILLYFIGKFFKQSTFFETLSTGTVQIGMRAVFALIILLVGLSEQVGAESILGAFLAGVLVSLLAPNREMVRQLDSFGYGFLIPIFFVMVGVELDLWALFSDPRIVILIPLLFIALLISKLVPVLYLKKWYDWNTIIGSGFLLTATLSLVVAAAKIGERIGVIDNQMSSALILLAVITCIVTPIVFKKVFPLNLVASKTKKVNVIGANQLTLRLPLELDPNLFNTTLYHTKQEKLEEGIGTNFEVNEVDDYEIERLLQDDVFNTDVLVVTTGNDSINSKIASYAKETGIERVITRIESSKISTKLKEKDIEVFSSLLSAKTILRSMIETPDVAKLIIGQENRLYQVNVQNNKYVGTMLRNFPFMGNAIIIRIFRGNESIVPHGDTEIQLHDHLIVTGSNESIQELRNALS
ncbi:monovalent cation:proton antiporter family protein [Pseudalkalibacillus salsuginis]|uniref:monovalent cation:proton antiporter family protein n=1 Tax=Pseudalkalibacillus salsuginis TaxID=2910972 RepID=UPI001F30E8BE|nr:monovalent cation:proton antiporter family protein [Pseudalkalibacillus salsuginis]MCF6409176.1 monovalent cation:proton antiporter family protein [Pseudalkalibacillus salsuginis]